MSHLSLRTAIAAPPERCIEFALTVETHLDYPGSRERAIDGVTSGRLGLNDSVTWESRRLAIPVRMTSKITALDAPHSFVDEMQRGPFRSWRHVHRFEAVGEGTLMTDEIDYSLPFRRVGAVVDRLLVRRYMMRLASELNDYIRRLAETTSAPNGLSRPVRSRDAKNEQSGR